MLFEAPRAYLAVGLIARWTPSPLSLRTKKPMDETWCTIAQSQTVLKINIVSPVDGAPAVSPVISVELVLVLVLLLVLGNRSGPSLWSTPKRS